MHKIFNKRKFIFVLIITIFIFLSLEFIFFLYFHFNNLNYKLSVYSEKRESSLSYDYFPNVDLVLPMPNINVTHYTSEFVDVFPTITEGGEGVTGKSNNENLENMHPWNRVVKLNIPISFFEPLVWSC